MNNNLNIIALSDSTDVQFCGGKASGLSQVMALDIAVPEGLVLPNAVFKSFLNQKNLNSRITSVISSLSLHNISELRKVAETIHAWVMDTPFPSYLVNDLQQQWEQQLYGKTLIVRSSAIGEDSNEVSFAGQLDSYLNINTNIQLYDAIKQCWASYWNERVLSYQLSTGKQLQGMAVLVQCQVDSKLAGVLFTKPPIELPGTKKDNETMLVEYCFGQGNALVSGQLNPGQFLLDKQNLQCEHISSPVQSDENLKRQDIDWNWTKALADAALTLERHFGRAQDIEWALDDNDNLFIVQSRAIVTSFPAKEKVSKVSKLIWSNANVRENFPDPVTPLLYSVASAGYRHYFRNLGLAFGISKKRIESNQTAFNNIIGVHGARIYYNLSNIHRVIRIVPFGNRLVEYFNTFVGVPNNTETSNTYNEHHSKQSKYQHVSQYLRLSYIALKTSLQFVFLGRRVIRFELRVDSFAAETGPAKLKFLGIIELRDYIRKFIFIRIHQWLDASLADAAAMFSYGLLTSLLTKYFPEKNQETLPNNYLMGITGLVSSEPVCELWTLSRDILKNKELLQIFTEVSSNKIISAINLQTVNKATQEFSTSLNDYINNWGFRCSGELMLTVPSFQEEPVGLIEILKSYLKITGDSPIEVLNTQKVLREKNTVELFAKISSNTNFSFIKCMAIKWLFKIVLSWTQAAIKKRERVRLKQALLYNRLRRIALFLGEQFVTKQLIDNVDDIFFLSYQEIDELASSREMFPNSTNALIALRKSEHQRLSQMDPPDCFELAEGDYLKQTSSTVHITNKSEHLVKNHFSGTTACGGKVTGRATVLTSVAESEQLSAGDILITTQTDPGWAHIFFLIKGLVIERGGMLSHGAILAREFGIPAIVGVNNITQNIPQHSTIYLDADQGQVHVPK